MKHVIGCYVRLVQKVRKGRFPYANGNGRGLAHHGKGGACAGEWAGRGIPRVFLGGRYITRFATYGRRLAGMGKECGVLCRCQI